MEPADLLSLLPIYATTGDVCRAPIAQPLTTADVVFLSVFFTVLAAFAVGMVADLWHMRRVN